MSSLPLFIPVCHSWSSPHIYILSWNYMSSMTLKGRCISQSSYMDLRPLTLDLDSYKNDKKNLGNPSFLNNTFSHSWYLVVKSSLSYWRWFLQAFSLGRSFPKFQTYHPPLNVRSKQDEQFYAVKEWKEKQFCFKILWSLCIKLYIPSENFGLEAFKSLPSSSV